MIIKNRKIRYFFFIILFLLIAHIFYVALAEIVLEKRIENARKDMHNIRNAIRVFSADWSQFPVSDDVFTSGSVYHQRYCNDPGQRIDSDMLLLLEGFSLKAWAAQAKGIELCESIYNEKKYYSNPEAHQKIQDMIGPSPKDYWWAPYEELDRGRLYGYRKLTTPRAYLKYIPEDPFSKDPPFLYRYGAIMQEGESFTNFMWILLGNGPDGDVDIRPEYIANDEKGDLVIYDNYPFKGEPESFWDIVYDPTNGVQSNGDLVLSSLFK